VNILARGSMNRFAPVRSLCPACATPDSLHCAAAKIGKGIADKEKEQQRAAEQEAIESGMMRIGGRGKKRAAERRAHRDRGLNEAPNFSPGLMHVSKPDSSRKVDGVSLSIGSSRGGGRGRGRGRGGGRGGRSGGGKGRGGGRSGRR
jgi:hypothetical protein